MPDLEQGAVLKCVPCGSEAEGRARGWRAFLTDEELEPEEVVIYCPDCSEAEFDG